MITPTRREFLITTAVAAGALALRDVQALAQTPQREPIPGPEVGEPTVSFALRNVTVIDCTGKPARPGMTVVIANDRIKSIGRVASTPLRSDVAVLDAGGKFLIPGLWDMHTHPSYALPPLLPEFRPLPTPTDLLLFVANGVTGVRMMGPNSPLLYTWQADVAAGRRLGPRIVVGHRIDGSPKDPRQTMKAFQGWVDTIEDGRQAVRAAVQNGADFIKVYSEFMTRDLYHAIAEEAKSRRIPFAGHGREPARQHRQHPSDQFRVNRRQGLSQVRVGHYSQRG